MARVDVLIPTYRRPEALAVTLTALGGQTMRDIRIVISDQTEDCDVFAAAECLVPVLRMLRATGTEVETHRHLPRQGLAEQRDFLLSRASAPYALYIDDDVILEPRVVQRLLEVIEREGCGFAGNSVVGLSFLDDLRPQEQHIEFWDGPVRPETVRPDTPEWERWRLHNAANLWHLQRRLGITDGCPRTYRVAWVAACVLYDVAALRDVGGFGFWRELPPEHCGEDVLAQLRVMRRYGGCGVLPTGAFHQELRTTVPRRDVDAPRVLPI